MMRTKLIMPEIYEIEIDDKNDKGVYREKVRKEKIPKEIVEQTIELLKMMFNKHGVKGAIEIREDAEYYEVIIKDNADNIKTYTIFELLMNSKFGERSVIDLLANVSFADVISKVLLQELTPKNMYATSRGVVEKETDSAEVTQEDVKNNEEIIKNLKK